MAPDAAAPLAVLFLSCGRPTKVRLAVEAEVPSADLQVSAFRDAPRQLAVDQRLSDPNWRLGRFPCGAHYVLQAGWEANFLYHIVSRTGTLEMDDSGW
jgi:hypothetical protein